jgi:flagellar hook-length control protein FliK
VFSPQLISAAILPGMAPPSEVGQLVPQDPGIPLSGNDFAWILAAAGGQLPGAEGQLFGEAELPPELTIAPTAEFAGLQNTPFSGMLLPPAGMNPPPVAATAPDSEPAPDALPELSVLTDAPDLPPPVPANVLSALKDQLELTRSRNLAEPIASLTETADSAQLLDLKPSVNPTTPRGIEQLPPIPLPATPVQQPGFDQAVGQRLLVMLQHGQQDARIRVHPENLGSVDIQLKLDGDEARVFMASPHAAVRDALESALPRLRDFFNEAGLSLAHFDVGANDSQAANQFRRDSGTGSGFEGLPGPEGVDGGFEEPGMARIALGLVDTFA